MQKFLFQELTEDSNDGTLFHDSKFPTVDGQAKELFFSSDANALIEHTKKVLVIEDDEVVHLKVHSLFYLLLSSSNIKSLCADFFLFMPPSFLNGL